MRAHPEALYFHIARRVLDGIDDEGDEFQLAQRVGTAIVFSALTLEAFINQEFGLHSETQKIIRDEKGITLKTKWLLLPLLLRSEKSFETGGQPFQKFSELVALRNAIFHFNPTTPFDPHPKHPSKIFFSDLVKKVDIAKSCFNVVEEMIRKLHELTEGKTEIPHFLHGTEYLTTIWSDIKVLIEIEAPQGS
jgi:hypothetical protein